MFQRRAFLGSMVAAILAPNPLATLAQTPVASPVAGISAEIDALLLDQMVDVPFSGAALITIAGEPVLDAAYGPADGVTREPNTTTTGFQIASVTKTFTAALTLQVRDEGAFELDDPASDLLPEFADQLDSGATPVTVRHLLNHTSGVIDFLEVYDPFDIDSYPESLEVLLERMITEPLLFTPGTQYHYSNTGYLYLGRITEAITGQSWETALAERILDPLELNQTWLTAPANRGDLATGYLPIEGFVLPVSRFGRPDLAEAAGGLTSTTHDLHRWLDAVLAGEVVSETTVLEMLEPGNFNYGLGWEVNDYDDETWVGHFGQTIGFRSALFREPERDLTIILLSNRQDYPIERAAGAIRTLLLQA